MFVNQSGRGGLWIIRRIWFVGSVNWQQLGLPPFEKMLTVVFIQRMAFVLNSSFAFDLEFVLELG